jgi:transcriptional regulator with XRE-family HTH domain
MSGLILLGERIDYLTSCLGVTDAQLATILGVQLRTVERWRAEEAFPQHESRNRLEALVALVNRLGESFKSPEGALRWLHSASGYFGGLAPMDALLRGRIDLVDAALEAMDSGVFV